MGNFYKEGVASRLGGRPTPMLPSEPAEPEADPEALQRQVSLLQQRARALEGEVQHRRNLEEALREALAERHRAEEELRASEHELMDFFENAVFGLQRLSADGTIQWANRAELTMMGWTREEYVGRNIAEFHVNPHVVAEILARVARNEVVKDHEARLRCRDGSIRSVLIDANARFEGGRFVYARCSTRDISDRKRLERELREQNDELARAVRFSETFVGILGHDLRNPLSAITTAASLLARRADSERVSKPAARILNSGRRMARMIDQLLDFTRIRLGKGIPLERSELDLGETCRLALDEVDSGEKDKVRIEASGDVCGAWDGDRLSQLISNLLGNALAHRSGEGPVTVAIDGTRPTEVVLAVENEGVIPPELKRVLFEPLKDKSDRKHERSSGLGLGLYISQQIVLAHGGTIEIVSTEEEGTRVVVTLPRTSRLSEPAFESSLRDPAPCGSG